MDWMSCTASARRTWTERLAAYPGELSFQRLATEIGAPLDGVNVLPEHGVDFVVVLRLERGGNVLV